jgi:antitoxin HigA-1
MVTKRLRPVHPGDILLRDFMRPLKLSSYKVAKELGVTAPSINEIVRRRRAVTAEMALRLSRFFGTSAELWLNLQAQFDLEVASRRIGKKVERTIRRLKDEVRKDLKALDAYEAEHGSFAEMAGSITSRSAMRRERSAG